VVIPGRRGGDQPQAGQPRELASADRGLRRDEHGHDVLTGRHRLRALELDCGPAAEPIRHCLEAAGRIEQDDAAHPASAVAARLRAAADVRQRTGFIAASISVARRKYGMASVLACAKPAAAGAPTVSPSA